MSRLQSQPHVPRSVKPRQTDPGEFGRRNNYGCLQPGKRIQKYALDE